MAAVDTTFETPHACPFLAFELDRDHRSDRPDDRHRCFAEPTAAALSVAHQETYCLSPNFAACPIFQDWAVRAAARPLASPVVAAAPQALPVDTASVAEPVTASNEELSATGAAAPAAAIAAAGIAAPTFATTFDDSAEHQQLSAFDEQQPSSNEFDAEHPGPVTAVLIPPPMPPAQSTQSAGPSATVAAAPAFLASRSDRPPLNTARDEIVPSWDLDGRYGAEPPPNGGGSRVDGILTAIAVLAIIGLGIAAVLFLPGLINHGATKPSNAPSSFVLPSGQPLTSSTEPSAVATVEPTAEPSIQSSVEPTAQASAGPQASPRLYRIKANDTLARIAQKFKVAVQAIIDANPQINDPNHVEVGQLIIIPQPPASSPPT